MIISFEAQEKCRSWGSFKLFCSKKTNKKNNCCRIRVGLWGAAGVDGSRIRKGKDFRISVLVLKRGEGPFSITLAPVPSPPEFGLVIRVKLELCSKMCRPGLGNGTRKVYGSYSHFDTFPPRFRSSVSGKFFPSLWNMVYPVTCVLFQSPLFSRRRTFFIENYFSTRALFGKWWFGVRCLSVAFELLFEFVFCVQKASRPSLPDVAIFHPGVVFQNSPIYFFDHYFIRRNGSW